MFAVLFAIVVIGMLVWSTWQPPAHVLQRAWLFALLLVPTWLLYPVRSIQLDLRTLVALTGILGLVTFGNRRAWSQLLFSDLCIIALLVVTILSNWLSGDLAPLTTVELVRVWFLPYAVGRMFLRSTSDLRSLLPWGAKLLLITAVLCLLEAGTGINPVNSIFGKSFGVLDEGEGFRWGMKRIQGMSIHPIFEGLILVLLLPWGLEYAFQKNLFRRRVSHWLPPLIVCTAVFLTVSRGAQLALAMTIAGTIFLRIPRWRRMIALVSLLAASTLYLGRDAAVDFLHKWSGEDPSSSRMLVIDGEEVEYSGTLHRFLLFKVYEQPLTDAGWLGFGGRRTGVSLSDGVDTRFASIDNHYIKFILEYGYLGLVAFLALGLSGIVYAIQVAWSARTAESGLAAGLAAAIFAVMCSLISVWFAPDFGTVWLFCVGLSASLKTRRPHHSAAPSPHFFYKSAPRRAFASPTRHLRPATLSA